MEYYVYQLIDPRNDLVFYVGKGCKNRMYEHEKIYNMAEYQMNPMFI